jgi:hypothetical protein
MPRKWYSEGFIIVDLFKEVEFLRERKREEFFPKVLILFLCHL